MSFLVESYTATPGDETPLFFLKSQTSSPLPPLLFFSAASSDGGELVFPLHFASLCTGFNLQIFTLFKATAAVMENLMEPL